MLCSVGCVLFFVLMCLVVVWFGLVGCVRVCVDLLVWVGLGVALLCLVCFVLCCLWCLFCVVVCCVGLLFCCVLFVLCCVAVLCCDVLFWVLCLFSDCLCLLWCFVLCVRVFVFVCV